MVGTRYRFEHPATDEGRWMQGMRRERDRESERVAQTYCHARQHDAQVEAAKEGCLFENEIVCAFAGRECSEGMEIKLLIMCSSTAPLALGLYLSLSPDAVN